MKRVVLVVFITWVSCISVYSQEEDFQSWYGVALEGELLDVLDYSFEPQLRLASNSSLVETWQTDFGVSYGLKKWCKVGGDYRLQSGVNAKDYIRYDHRFSVYTKFDVKWKKAKFSYKIKLQREYAGRVNSDNDKIPTSDHRHKIGVEYGKKKWFLRPFIGVEYYFRFQPSEESDKVKRRVTIGVKKRISKKVDVDLAYLRQDEFFVNQPLAKNVVSFGLSIDID